MNLQIPTPIPKDKSFEAYLKVLSCIPPFNQLRNRELEVLAEFYRVNAENVGLPEVARNRTVFHRDTRKMIADKLGISVQSVYNISLALRDAGILGEDCFIKAIPELDSITFNFIKE